MKFPHSAVIIFFLTFLIIGLTIFDDYGVSWDEPRSRLNGIVTVKYLIQKDPLLLNYEDKYYGPVFESFLVGLEKVLNLTDTRHIYLMRHLFTFFSFYMGVVFFFLLTKKQFKSWKIALLGCLFLILSPRIFAHSFYNSKDIPFLAMFIVSIYTLLRYLDKKTFINAVFHALACALLIDIRIIGVIVPFLTLVFVFLGYFSKRKENNYLSSFLFYIVLLFVLTVLFWPILWENPFYHLVMAFKQMSSFPWTTTVLYLGKYIEAKDLPWHYQPVWLLISTPLLYSFGFLAGLGRLLVKQRNNLIFLFWFIVPLASVILFKSVVYDSWRQLFFVYPAFLLISLGGLKKLWDMDRRWLKSLLIMAVILNLSATGYFMIRNHPYQNLYFNILAGRDGEQIKESFELDYWGLSYRKALEYLLENDESRKIKIFAANEPGINNSFLLKKQERERLVYVKDISEADYFLTNFRWHINPYPYKEIYSIKVNQAKIMAVYQTKE